MTAEEAEGERGGSQRSAASSSGNFRFRDVLEAEDASCLRGCCVDDVLREPNPVWCVWWWWWWCGGGGGSEPDAFLLCSTNLKTSTAVIK